MKKALSFALVLGIVFSSTGGLFAQKLKGGRNLPGTPKISVPATKDRNPVTEFGQITAAGSESGVLLRWQMLSEVANIGFRIYRIDGNGRTLVNSEFVYGSSSKAGRQPLYGENYAYFDRAGRLGTVYELESQDLDGKIVNSNTVSAAVGKIPDLEDSDIPGSFEYPVVNGNTRIGSTDLALPKEVAAEVESRSTSSDANTHKWVMSHPGVRIDVKKEGIYRVTFAQLQNAGFDTGTDPAFWQLYLSGVQQAIRVDAEQGFLEFYGKGIDTQETEIQGYFLINGPSHGKRMGSVVARPSFGTRDLSGYDQSFTYKERTIYLNSILNGDDQNFFGRGIPTGGTNITFDLTGIDFSNPTSTIDLRIQGYSSTLHVVRIILNGQQLTSMAGVTQFPFFTSQTIPTSLLKDASLGQGTNTLNLTSIGGSSDFSLFDTLTIGFRRKHLAQQDKLKAYSISGKKTLLRGFSSPNVRVFDLTWENEPGLITNLPFQSVGGAFGADLPSGRPKVFYAVADSEILSPHAIVAHDAEILGAPTQGAQVLIISYKDFLTQANAWAAYRASQGFSVKVVSVDEVFNEFDYGVQRSASIKTFLNYAYDNWQVRPKYVLLIGDASDDPRNYRNFGYFNLVPTKIVTTVFSETGSDESLADFNDDGLAEMPIGRIPARQVSAVNTAFAKTVNWEANLVDPLNRGALFAFDEPNGYDFQGMSNRLRDEITWPEGVTPTMVYRHQANANADLISGLNTGKYIVNYSGHGSTGAWASTSFFWNDNVASLTNQNNESIFTMLTCLNGYYLSVNAVSLAETLLQANNGGAVAVWSSTGLTTPDIQEVMGRRFYNKIGQGSIQRMGDLIEDAKTVIAAGTDVRLSWSLLGDPALKVR